MEDKTDRQTQQAQGDEAERVVRLQLANTLGVRDRLLMLVQTAVEHSHRRVGQGMVGLLLEQLPQLADRLFDLAPLL